MPIKIEFKGEIIGIDAGAGLMNSADKAVQDYSLDFDLKSSSGATMVAFLRNRLMRTNGSWLPDGPLIGCSHVIR